MSCRDRDKWLSDLCIIVLQLLAHPVHRRIQQLLKFLISRSSYCCLSEHKKCQLTQKMIAFHDKTYVFYGFTLTWDASMPVELQSNLALETSTTFHHGWCWSKQGWNSKQSRSTCTNVNLRWKSNKRSTISRSQLWVSLLTSPKSYSFDEHHPIWAPKNYLSLF